MRTSIIVLATALACASGGAASAQTADPKVYAELNVGGQMESVTLATASTFSLYGETGTTSSSQTVGNGLVFDGGAGYFIRPNLSVGVSVSMFTRSPAGTVSISTPDAIAFNSFTVLTSSPKLEHTELGTHLSVAYRVKLNDKTDVTISGGPSLVRLSKEIASGTLVNNAPQIVIAKQSASGFGAHGGADLSYFVTPQVGGGIFVRYVGATVDLPAATGISVGGFQAGLGVRVRF